MKFRPPLFDATDMLIFLVAAGAIMFIGALLTVEDVERFLSGNISQTPRGDAVGTMRVGPVDLERSGRAGWSVLLSAWDSRDVILHEGLIYMATGGGLLAYLPSGELANHYTHLNGLPSNRLACLAVWRGDLYIGCDKGLVRLRDGAATAFAANLEGGARVSSLMPYGDRLLVGTEGAGLLSFDGTVFRRDIGGLPGADFRHVTALAEWRGQVVVGSRERGLFLQRGASFTRVGRDRGLPHERVTALAPGDGLLVATLTGLCLLDDELRVTPWANQAAAAAMLKSEGGTLVGTLDGRIEQYSAGRRRSVTALGDKRFPVLIRRIARVDGRTWVLTSAGARILTPEGLTPFGERPSHELSNNHVAALTLDAGGNLWIGYFDAGIEIFSTELRPLRKHDDDRCRTVKCLYFDPAEGSVYVGSSQGLLRYFPDGSRTVWSREDGLISNEVNHVLRWNDEIVAGTGGGLSFLGGSAVRSIYAFHGLINNKVFSLFARGDELYVGTLGGISVLAGRRVVGQITPENSELPTHWVTALSDLDGSLLVGTYGEGLALRDTAGDWEELPRVVRGFEVNPNAVLLDGDLLLVGTLDRGLAILRRNSGRWEVTGRGLSSPNVTALAADERRLFIATDNGIMVVDRENL